MDKFSLSIGQLMAALEQAKILVGRLFFEPFGINPDPALTGFTLYFAIGALAYAMLRLVLPDHTRSRNYRSNVFGLRRNIQR